LQRHSWIADHPHVATPTHYNDARNVLYVAAEHSEFLPSPAIGGGVFSRFSESLQLTKAGATRSVWSLPKWFIPNGREPLSYHGNSARWQPNGSTVTLKTVAKGQEFVLDGLQYPKANPWVHTVVREGMQS
jgi:hypothetical protein